VFDVSRLPKPRVVVQFEFRGVPPRCRGTRHLLACAAAAGTWTSASRTRFSRRPRRPGRHGDLGAGLGRASYLRAGHSVGRLAGRGLARSRPGVPRAGCYSATTPASCSQPAPV